MPDSYLTTATTNFDKSTVETILKQVQQNLRGGLEWTPRGSIIPATLVPGSNGTFRSFAYSDLPAGGDVDLSDGQPDPDVESIEPDYVEFTGTRRGRLVGWTDNAQAKSPHSLGSIGSQKIAFAIAQHIDSFAKGLYKAGGATLFAGTGNAAVGDVASTDTLTASLLKRAVALLRAADVKPLPSGTFALVTGPGPLFDLREDDDFRNEMRDADPSTFLTGEVARYAGCSIIDAGSNGIVFEGQGASSIDVHMPTLIGADALFAGLGQIEVHTVNTPDSGDPLNRRHTAGYKGWFGGEVNDLQAERYLGIAVASTI